MPTIQFAEVPNKSSISNNCCVYAIKVIYYCYTSVSFICSHAVFQKLCMAIIWTYFHAINTKILPETKSINVIFLPYFQCRKYIGLSLPLGSQISNAFWNNFRLHVQIKAQSFQIYTCMHLLSLFSLNLTPYVPRTFDFWSIHGIKNNSDLLQTPSKCQSHWYTISSLLGHP